ncbi:MAG: nucleotidyltransferase domain-containing protein [Candidatus Muiribacteriota bacterium]|jgi:predicted nucleotidyltransferase
MIDLNGKQLEIINKILEKHLPKVKVVAFGSRVNNNSQKYSDIDLAIISEEKMTIEKMQKLKEEFEESELNIMVDIVEYNKVSESFKKNIDAKNIQIQ